MSQSEAWSPYVTVTVHFLQELVATMVFLVSLDRIGMYFFNLPIGASVLLMSILLVFVFPHLNPYISVLLYGMDDKMEEKYVEKMFVLFARIGAQMLAGFLAGSLLEYNYVDLQMNKGYVARIKYNTTMRPEDTTQSWMFPLFEELFAVFTFLTLIGWIILYYRESGKVTSQRDALNIYMAVCVSFALTLFAFPTARLSPAAYLSEWADKSNVVLPGGDDYKLLDENKNKFLWVRFAGGIIGCAIALLFLKFKNEFWPDDLKPSKPSVEASRKLRDDYIPMTLFKKG